MSRQSSVKIILDNLIILPHTLFLGKNISHLFFAGLETWFKKPGMLSLMKCLDFAANVLLFNFAT